MMNEGSGKPNTNLLIVATPGVDVAVVRRWQSRLTAAWPGGSQVRADVWPLDRVGPGSGEAGVEPAGELAGESAGTPAGGAAGRALEGRDALVVFGPTAVLSSDVRRLLEGAQDRDIPVVRLSIGPERRDRRDFCGPIRSAGAPLLPVDGDPALAAGVLLGMIAAARQRVELVNELEMERRVKASAARLIDHLQSETSLAVLVQRALLPSTQLGLSEVDAGVIYRPCSSLSGDLYDIVRLDDDHVAFFLADASGHGVAAALLTMLIGRLLPMKEVVHDRYRLVPPAEAVSRLNAAYVQRQPDASRLITAIYGVLDIRTGILTIASAGHPPAAIVGPDGLRLAGDSGPSLGLIDAAEFPSTTVRLAPGEAVMFYSDGFEWAFAQPVPGETGPDRRRPNDRYFDAFTAIGSRPGGQPLGEALLDFSEVMDRQHGSLHQPDDITLLAFSWREAMARANPLADAA